MISADPSAVRTATATAEPRPDLEARERTLRALAKAPATRAVLRAGLCTTCAQRFDCTFPAVPGGVWHCEEFA